MRANKRSFEAPDRKKTKKIKLDRVDENDVDDKTPDELLLGRCGPLREAT